LVTARNAPLMAKWRGQAPPVATSPTKLGTPVAKENVEMVSGPRLAT
jgi:hypothetical protein